MPAKKKLPDEASGRIASLTLRVRAHPVRRYLSPVTGAPGSDTQALAFSPHNSEVHSASPFRAGLSPGACSLGRRTTRTRPRHRFSDIRSYYMHQVHLVKALGQIPGNHQNRTQSLVQAISEAGVGRWDRHPSRRTRKDRPITTKLPANGRACGPGTPRELSQWPVMIYLS
jgi:hypothetical protein